MSYITLNITNLFSATAPNSTDYFGTHYSDDQVWFMFLNTGGNITYTDATSGSTKTVADAAGIQLSTVNNGAFALALSEISTRVFAGFGDSNPFTSPDGPGVFDQDIPYVIAEWTIQGNSYDNVDVTYIDTFAIPTTLTVKNGAGQQTDQATFNAGTSASDVIDSFKAKMPNAPVGPDNDNYPPSTASVGYGPLVSTSTTNNKANRWIASSKYWISGADSSELRSMYHYAPSFSDYLGYLQTNTPTTKTSAGDIKGWYIDYSGNGGYSGYMNVTGDATAGFGIEISNIRVKTGIAAGADAAPNAGTATTGTITVSANGATFPFPGDNGATNVTGPWADVVIYSGATVLGSFGNSPVVVGTDDFAGGATQEVIVPTFLASISASMATGLLGSNQFLSAYNGTPSKSTNYWFSAVTRADAVSTLFSGAWPGGEKYYDPYWAILAGYTGNEGYLSPFNDRWANFTPGFGLAQDYTIEWNLGIPA